jgi:hypothetical protein
MRCLVCFLLVFKKPIAERGEASCSYDAAKAKWRRFRDVRRMLVPQPKKEKKK